MDVEREKALRLHIRELIFDYALTHLTKDFISFTENAAIEVTPFAYIRLGSILISKALVTYTKSCQSFNYGSKLAHFLLGPI